jgi:hypothetical protein
MNSALQRRFAQTPKASVPDAVASLWRGTVVEALSNGLVWVKVPRLAGDDPIGPMPTLPLTVRAGDAVLVGAIEDSRADLMVVATVVPGLTGTSQVFESLELTGAPTLAAHATRKDYVDTEMDAAVTAAVAGARAYTDAQLVAAVETLTADVPWTDLTLSGAWVAYAGADGHRPGLRARVKDGFLEVTGAVQSGGPNTDIATFPAGMVPAYAAARPCIAVDGLGAEVLACVMLLPAGTSLSYMAGPDAPALLSINERIPMT